MPVNRCTCCERRVGQGDLVNCAVCNDAYAVSCTELSTEVVKLIKSKKSLYWSCQKCSEIGSSLKDLKTLIVSLQREIEKLKAVRDTPSDTGNANVSFDFEEVIQEISERNSRKKNIIFFGIPESTAENSGDRGRHDERKAVELFNHILPDTQIELARRPMRLGRLIPNNQKPRPLKVVLPSDSLAHDIIQNARRLNQSNFANVRVSLDKTPRQQEQYRKLKNELTRRVSNGEPNLRIKYIRGVPKIISSLPVN